MARAVVVAPAQVVAVFGIARRELFQQRVEVGTAPGSNSMVVTAAVDPTTKTVAMPAAEGGGSTAAATAPVMSWASPCPRVGRGSRGCAPRVLE